MISKKLNFVVDLKGEDILAPQFVPSHASALRQYQLVADSKENRPIFADYPEDFVLVTGSLDFVSDSKTVAISDVTTTPFSQFIKKAEGDVNG